MLALMRRHRALVALLIAGAAVRVALMFIYSPAYLSYFDTWGYAKAAAGPLFMDDWIRPAGYPAMLAALHAIWGELTFAIAVQHLLGLATVVLTYALMLRLGAARGTALVVAAVPALTIDALFYEHTLLSEGPFTLLVLASVYTTAIALERPVALGWAAGAGALAAAAVMVRGTALFAVPVLVALMALAAAGPWRRRLAGAGALAATCFALLLGYAALQSTQNGYFGLTEGSGWATYARAAPFADCSRFTPPTGTDGLCETTDVRDREGPDFYAWKDGSPARRLFRGPPHEADLVGSFGRAAILGLPRAYVSAVATDIWRYVVSDAGIDRDDNGDTPSELSIALRRPAAEATNLTTVEQLYGDVKIETSGAVDVVGDLQEIVRVHGPLILFAVLAAAVALPFAEPRRRIAILLLGAAGLVPVIFATMTVVYNWRYMVPALPLIVGAGALGVQVLAARWSERNERGNRELHASGQR